MLGSRLSIFVLNLVSAIMTGLGYFTFFRPVAERMVDPETGVWVAAALGLGGSLVVQVLVYSQWSRFGQEGRLLSVTLPAAMIASVLSWTGSAAGMLLLVNEATLLGERQQAQATLTAEPLNRFADSFARLQADLRRAAADAAGLADAETQGRPTCTNDETTVASCGVRCRFRKDQAQELGTLVQVLADPVDRARNLSRSMTLAGNAAEQRAVYEEALTLKDNSIQIDVASRLQALAAQFGTTLSDPGTQKEFICEDAAFAARLGALAEQMQTRVALPDAPPTAQRVDMSDTMACVGQRVLDLAGLAEPCSKAIGDGALLTAFVLELALVVLLLADMAHARRYGALPTEGEVARMLQARSKNRADADFDAWLLATAARHMIDAAPQGRFIAVPVDSGEQARLDGERLVRIMRAGRPVFLNVPLDQTDHNWTQARAGAFEGATLFNFYRWPAWGDRILERAANRAAGHSWANAAA